jgi:ATP-dependent RNA helicase DDX5/DBP2
VANYIEREVAGVRAEALHGDLMQGRRDRVRDNVKTGRAQASAALSSAPRASKTEIRAPMMTSATLNFFSRRFTVGNTQEKRGAARAAPDVSVLRLAMRDSRAAARRVTACGLTRNARPAPPTPCAGARGDRRCRPGS